MALEGETSIQSLKFDFSKRQLTVIHEGDPKAILTLIEPLKLNSSLKSTEASDEIEEVLSDASSPVQTPGEEKVLKQLLAINGLMFVIEVVIGWIAQSTGLLSDSLDMFADAAVYSLSLYAVGKAIDSKKRAAKISGILQIILACGAFFEIARRFLTDSEPDSMLMIGTASLAMIANISCLFLLARHRKGEVHMRASWIFSTNDVIANGGVIIAGILVYFTKSPLPDLLIGAVIAAVVLSGALRIFKLAK